jgi:hypothetical protein
LDAECAVVCGVDADDVAGVEVDFAVAAECADDGFGFLCFDFGFAGAECYEYAGGAGDAGTPCVAVGGGDDAPFGGLGGLEDEFGECLCAGACFP